MTAGEALAALEQLMAEGRADHQLLGRVWRARRRVLRKRALRRLLSQGEIGEPDTISLKSDGAPPIRSGKGDSDARSVPHSEG